MNRFLFFFFVLCVPSVLAIDCNSVIHADYCKQIQNSGLSVDEKAYLLGNIMSDKHTTPDHAMVSAWNTNIPTDIKPEGVLTADKGVIKNAWVKVLAVAPSVLLNKSLVIDSSGVIRTNFKHEIVIPTGVESGDCQTYRSVQEHTDVINLYGNDVLLGEGHDVLFQSLSGDVLLKAVETISDISTLSGLTKLEGLSLDNSQISDISVLKDLTKLTWLLLDGNQISDISALKWLTSLQSLYIQNNKISDLSPLKGLTSLNNMVIKSNPFLYNSVNCDAMKTLKKSKETISISGFDFAQCI